MGLSRCYSLMKCLLILFNIIFLCVGCLASGFAGWALWDGAGEGAAGRAGLGALLGWGLVLGGAALVALGGLARGGASALAAAFALLALAAVAEGGAAWWGAAHLPQLRRALLARLDTTVRLDYGVSPARTHMLDAIQQGLECCGASSGVRDWQESEWSRAQLAERAGASGVPGGAAGVPPSSAHAADPLDLSVGAPPTYYYVPASCCQGGPGPGCEAARAVGVGAGAGAGAGRPGLHGAACGARLVAALAGAARAPLLGAALLLAAHGAALLLTLALCLRTHPPHNYKA